jgi:uncharacterized protein (TIGR00369 family)
MAESGKPIERYPACFVCGDRNQIGLKIAFFYDGEKAFAEFTPGRLYEGYHTVCHGGILASVLDEVMVKAVLAEGRVTVTGRLEIRYRRPARTGELLRAEGRVTRRCSRLLEAAGSITDQRGRVICEATASYCEVRDERIRELMTNSGDDGGQDSVDETQPG